MESRAIYSGPVGEACRICADPDADFKGICSACNGTGIVIDEKTVTWFPAMVGKKMTPAPYPWQYESNYRGR